MRLDPTKAHRKMGFFYALKWLLRDFSETCAYFKYSIIPIKTYLIRRDLAHPLAHAKIV